MPPRKKAQMPDHVKEAVLEDVALSHQQAIAASEHDKIRIHLAWVQGATTKEIADKLGVSQQVVSKWRGQGEQALERRRRGDPERSGEPEPDG